MSHNERLVNARPGRVWSVLADGWLYPLWVVGASRMREVDAGWPAVGARLHHSVGSWPLLIDDTTSVLECVPEERLVLQARAWPTGEARVEIGLEDVGPVESGEESRTRVTIEEDAASGPAQLLPAPLRHPMLAWRNVESLRRLAFLAERRTR